jgi:hypothetical protein
MLTALGTESRYFAVENLHELPGVAKKIVIRFR